MSCCVKSKVPRHLALYPAETVLGWRIIRRVSLDKGLEHEQRGVWRRVLDPVTLELIGFQMIAAKVERGDRDLPTTRSCAAIPAREMELNAQRSRTAGMSEDRRQERAAAGRRPEDAIERVQCKVMVYPHINGAPGDILRVWPK